MVSIARGTDIQIDAIVTVNDNMIVFHAKNKVFWSVMYSMNLFGDDIRFIAT